jgi:L-malate glycosyltransferase
VARAPARTREEVREALDIPAGARVIGSAARLVVQKRFDRLLRALARLPADVHLVVAGEGGQRGALEALARELGVAERAHLLGRRDDIPDILAALDVFVISSDKEGLSNAMLEALSQGVPVVSTAVSGAPEALAPLPDGSAPGLIVELEPSALAEGIRGLLDDPGLRRRMSEAAVRRVKERFDFDGMISRWERVLSDGGPGE